MVRYEAEKRACCLCLSYQMLLQIPDGAESRCGQRRKLARKLQKKCLSVVKKKILVNSCWAESVVSSLSACGPLFAARLWLLVHPSNPSPSWLRVAVSLIHSQAGRAVLQGSLALEEEGEIQKEAVFGPG